jgi:glycosyltransferase involved in cell wall biosynthesis
VGACDVVHVHDYLYVPTLAAILFGRLRRRPVVLTQHVGEIAYRSGLARRLLQALHRVVGALSLGAASRVVFVGHPVQTYFRRFVRFRREPILIANGVDQTLYQPAGARASEGASSGRDLHALFVGRFVEKKGLRLLEACMDVPGIRWEFVGRGPLSPEHWEVPAGVLTLRGALAPAAVAEAMRAADLLVLPSHGEGFPLVVQEALACGTPVLVSQEVADAFTLSEPRCVWSVDVAGDGAVVRLRAALARLAAARESVRSARPLAAALARQWSWERCVESYLAIYHELTRRGSHPAADRGAG